MTDEIKLKFNSKSEILKHYTEMYKRIPNSFIEKIEIIIKYLKTDLSSILESEYYFAFTGGKDCLAALIIMKLYYFLKQRNDFTVNIKSLNSFFAIYSTLKLPKEKFKFVYFMNNLNFEDEEDYIVSFIKDENLDIIYIYSDFINGVKILINKYDMNYILMGTRKTDIKNYREVDTYQFLHKSTYPYPDFNRVYPVFHLDYEDIWRLLLLSKVNYLNLYNYGYSSIGEVSKCIVNEHLKFKNETLPAWCLNLEFSYTERSNRIT